MKKLKSILGNNTFIYLIGDLLSRVAPFLIVPLVSKKLGVESLANYSNYFLILFLSQSIISMLTIPYLGVAFFKYEDKYNRLIKFLVDRYFFLMTLSCLTSISLFLAFEKLELFIIINAVFFTFYINVYQNHLQVKKMAKEYSLINLCKGAGYLLLTAIAFLFDSINVNVLFLLNLGVLLSVSIYSYIRLGLYANEYFLIKDNNINFSILKASIIFGSPLIPSLLINSVRTMIDRFFIIENFDMKTMGVYAGVFQMASLVMILSSSLVKSYSPEIMKGYVDKNFNLVKRVILKLSAFIFIFSLIVNVVLYQYGWFIFSDDFISETKIFSFIVWIFCFQAIASFFTSYYQYHEKTKMILNLNIFSLFIYYLCVYSLSKTLGEFILLAIFVSIVNLLLVLLFGGARVIKANQ